MPRMLMELVAVLLLVLLFFFLILGALRTLFPSGYSLMDMLQGSTPERHAAEKDPDLGDYRLRAGSEEGGLDVTGRIIATLSTAVNQVKSKRANQIAWKKSEEGMVLLDSDAVQTFRQSGASLTFIEGNGLEMGENTLVVLRRMERDIFTRESTMNVALVTGELTGEVASPGRESFSIQVAVPGGTALAPSSGNRDKPARFKMTVGPDDSSVLTVLEGNVDLAVDGKTIVVGPDRAVRFQPGSSLAYVKPPPPPPALKEPDQDQHYYYRNIPPRVTFRWQETRDSQGYIFVLARDPGFRDVVLEKELRSASLNHGNLKPGEYFWRVRSVSRDEEGGYGRARRLTLIQDLEVPALEVHYPETDSESERFRISGMTEPGTRIFVSGMPARVDSAGRFTYDLFLERGFNTVVVEAVDQVGNINYYSKTVNVEF